MRHPHLLLFLTSVLLVVAPGCLPRNGDVCTPSSQVDPLSDCYCHVLENDNKAYDTNAPPVYQAETASAPDHPGLYAPEAVTPSHGSSHPGGPALVPH